MKRNQRCKCRACDATATGGRGQCAKCKRYCQQADAIALDRLAIRQEMRDLGVPVRRIRLRTTSGLPVRTVSNCLIWALARPGQTITC